MRTNLTKIPVVDLFAGPGGLGEGFASCTREDGSDIFQSVVSIERDNSAHQTLHLRHFLRAFPKGKFQMSIMNIYQVKFPNKTFTTNIQSKKNMQILQL